jgi:uncharacterized protein (DUF885 family)
VIRTAASALALALVAAAPLTASAQTAPAAPTAATAPAQPQSEDQRLAAFFEQAFQEQVALSPETMTQFGIKQRYGELGDYTDAANVKQMQLAEAQLARMKRDFRYERLSDASKLSYRLFEQTVAQGRLQFEYRWNQYPITTEGTVAGQLPALLINAHRVETVEDARAYVSRLNAVERAMGEVSADMEERARRGVLAPAFVYEPVLSDTRALVAGAPFGPGEDNPLWADFKKKVAALKTDEATKAQLLKEGQAALTGPFRRGYERFLATVTAQQKAANSTDGVWRLPNGPAYYAAQVRFYTTTDLTPDQVHEIGRKEVARIHAEMEAIKAKVGFQGTLQDFFRHVRAGDQFHYPNTEAGKQQYLADAKAIVARYMASAGKQFSRLPKAALEVRAVEAWREKTAPVAFYNPPALDGSRPGIYYVNLSDMGQVLKPQIEGITCHEAAPGHHFQLARSIEQQDLPTFRKVAYQGAYIEGWGLYAERLCQEVGGFYTDPYSDFGRLSLELWRAGRLVVDTGIHAKRWSRDQAIKYFTDNTLLSERDVVKEINRYITNPGQATSYKVGQLKILELRDKARAALGPRFDEKAFHEAVLANGAMPLNVLEQQIDAFIAANRG